MFLTCQSVTGSPFSPPRNLCAFRKVSSWKPGSHQSSVQCDFRLNCGAAGSCLAFNKLCLDTYQLGRSCYKTLLRLGRSSSSSSSSSSNSRNRERTLFTISRGKADYRHTGADNRCAAVRCVDPLLPCVLPPDVC